MTGRLHDEGMTELRQAVEAVLAGGAPQLQALDIESVARTFDSVSSLLSAGESVVGLEILCDNLYEDEISVPRGMPLNLLAAAQRMDLDTKRIDRLLA
jgi:hypothetical protein